jgi:glutathione synthase/RimK-type ligase-like ATP-grasp enzyme
MALAMMHAAKMQNAEAVLFSPEGVDLLNGRIMGQGFTGTKWVQVETRLPDVIDNDDIVFESGRIWTELTRTIPFTTYRLGGKAEVVKRMAQANFRLDLQIPTEHVSSLQQFKTFVNTHRRAVVKPARGSGGKGIVFVTKLENGYEVNLGHGAISFSDLDMAKLFDTVISQRDHVVQAFITSQTKTGAPFDIRLHVRRDSMAQWRVVRIYARVGTGLGLTSNIGLGGAFANSKNFISNQFGDKANEILKTLRDLARNLPNQFQDLYPDRMIDALGFDLGIDQDGQPWLFEVNSYPGSQMFTLEDSIVRTEFALYLARQRVAGIKPDTGLTELTS